MKGALIFLKGLNVLFCGAFLLAAYWQHNDPDWVVWFLTYSVGAALCVAAAFRRYIRVLPILGIVVCLSWSAYLYFHLEIRGIEVEEWREAWGLVLGSIGMLNLLVMQKLDAGGARSSKPEMGEPAAAS